MCCCAIKTSSTPPGKSSVIFGILQKMFGKVCIALITILENLRHFSESGRKSTENCQKRLISMWNTTWAHLGIWIFSFSSSTWYFTSEHNSLVKYQVEHLKIKFISTSGHGISSISLICVSQVREWFVFMRFVFKSLMQFEIVVLTTIWESLKNDSGR